MPNTVIIIFSNLDHYYWKLDVQKKSKLNLPTVLKVLVIYRIDWGAQQKVDKNVTVLTTEVNFVMFVLQTN